MKKFAACFALTVLLGTLSIPAHARPHKKHKPKPLKTQIAELLADPAVSRAHWGIVVTEMDSRPIYGLNEAQLFQPASNNKMFTTATALALLSPANTIETRIVAKGVFNGPTKLSGNVVLIGAGDANLSGRALP